MLTKPVVKTHCISKQNATLPNKNVGVQNKQEKKSQLHTSGIPHHQHMQHDKSHENVKLTMDNLHTQNTEEKSIQTEDQPKIANCQVESQNQYTMDYKDESKHEDILCIQLKNIQLIILTIL